MWLYFRKWLPKWHSVKRICLLMQESQQTQIRSLGREDPQEEEMTTHSSILAWKIPWTEEPARLQSMEHKKSDMAEQLNIILQKIFLN